MVQPSGLQLFVTLWTTALQASLSFTISWSLLKPMSIESVMHPLLLSSTPALYLAQPQGLFQGIDPLHKIANVLELQLQHQSLTIQG